MNDPDVTDKPLVPVDPDAPPPDPINTGIEILLTLDDFLR